MPTLIPAVAQTQTKVINAEFVILTVNDSANVQQTTTYTFSNSYKTESFSVGGVTYTFQALGSYLSVAPQQRDLELTAYDTTITLAGIVEQNIYAVLSSDHLIKGSQVEIWRGFYDANYNLDTMLSPPVRRYRGIVTSWNISETRENQTDDFVVSINCSNFKTVLENRIAGRFTNPTNWQYTYNKDQPTQGLDTSMRNVPNLINKNFDFGKKATAQGQNTSKTNVYSGN